MHFLWFDMHERLSYVKHCVSPVATGIVSEHFESFKCLFFVEPRWFASTQNGHGQQTRNENGSDGVDHSRHGG